MCIIVVKPSGSVLPQKNTLRSCFENNNDGAGYVFQRKGDNILYLKKGFMKFKPLWKALSKLNIKDEDRIIIHFRIGTSGLMNAKMCHPFVVGEEPDKYGMVDGMTKNLVVAHNGVISNLSGGKKLSDTALLVKNILSSTIVQKGLYKDLAIQELIETFIDSGRLAFLHPSKGIMLLGDGWLKAKSGVYYSNTGYKKKTYVFKGAWDGLSKRGNHRTQYGNYDNDYAYGYGDDGLGFDYHANKSRADDNEKLAENLKDTDTTYSDYCEGCGNYECLEWNVPYSAMLCDTCLKVVNEDNKKGALIKYYDTMDKKEDPVLTKLREIAEGKKEDGKDVCRLANKDDDKDKDDDETKA